jgi:hypothetical protein
MTISDDFKELEARLRRRKSLDWVDPDLEAAADAIDTLRAERDAARGAERERWANFISNNLTCGTWWFVERLRNNDFEDFEPKSRMTEWRDISTAPRDGTRVLIVGGNWLAAVIASADGKLWGQPTHWRPLPLPPPAIP